MDFDEMLDTWRAQNNAPPYEVNRDALRQALQAEEAKVQGELRTRRRGFWFVWIFYTGMAVWAVLWIAITISNGWPVFYVITSVVSLAMFAFGVGAAWVSRGPRPEPPRNFGHTLQEEVQRNLALVDDQLSLNKNAIIHVLGAVFLVVGTLLFSWTVNRSQDIPPSSFGGWWLILLVGWSVWVLYKAGDHMRKAKPKLELRRRRLRELLAALEAGE